MLALLIKGSSDDAHNAANLRGIKLRDLRPIRNGAWTETVAYCDDDERRRVARWFGEAGDAPFPMGTLLHYSEKAEVSR